MHSSFSHAPADKDRAGAGSSAPAPWFPLAAQQLRLQRHHAPLSLLPQDSLVLLQPTRRTQIGLCRAVNFCG